MYSGAWKNGVISGIGHKAYADGSSVKGISIILCMSFVAYFLLIVY